MIDENEFRETVEQATTLPTGWAWHKYGDGSGSLHDPAGNKSFSYDRGTGEYKINDNKRWDFWLGRPCYMDDDAFKSFQSWAEAYVKENVLKDALLIDKQLYCQGGITLSDQLDETIDYNDLSQEERKSIRDSVMSLGKDELNGKHYYTTAQRILDDGRGEIVQIRLYDEIKESEKRRIEASSKDTGWYNERELRFHELPDEIRKNVMNTYLSQGKSMNTSFRISYSDVVEGTELQDALVYKPDNRDYLMEELVSAADIGDEEDGQDVEKKRPHSRRR